MKRRNGFSRSVLLGVVLVIIVIVLGVLYAVTLSGSTTSSRTSSSSSRSSSSLGSSTTTTSSTQVTVGAFNLSQPIGAVFDRANGHLYVTNNYTNTVSVIDPAAAKLLATIRVGLAPATIVVDPVNGYLYVTNNDSGSVSVIDGTSNSVIKTIPVGGDHPDGITLDSANNCLYVAEHGNGAGGDEISVINATTNTDIREISGIFHPTGVAYDPTNGDVYVTTGGTSVLVIGTSTNTILTQIDVGNSPEGIVLDPSNGDLYVANTLSGTVSVVSGSTNAVVATISVSPTAVRSVPFRVAYDSADGYIMITNDYTSGVNVINGTTNAVVTTVSTGFQSEPADLAFDASNGDLYVVGHATYSLIAISPSLTAATLQPSGG